VSPHRAPVRALITGIGAVVRVNGNLIVSAHLLMPIAHAGLRSGVSLVAGLDYTF